MLMNCEENHLCWQDVHTTGAEFYDEKEGRATETEIREKRSCKRETR